MKNVWEVFTVFLRLGLTSFGGPVAHLGYFHNEFVGRRKWISDGAYADLVSLCQLLPGPASSQVGISLGLARAGMAGAVVAWLGFALPSAVLMVAFALGLTHFQSYLSDGFLHGLRIVAVAVVAQALWAMGVKLCPDKRRATIAVAAALLTSCFSFWWVQIAALIGGAVIGGFLLEQTSQVPHTPIKIGIGRKGAVLSLVIFIWFLVVLPVLIKLTGDQSLNLFDEFFRAGSLVFGGGHVVLPMSQSEVVPRGLMTNDVFMAGYGAAQALPGPLFTFAAYLGAISKGYPNGLMGASVALVAIFLPSFLLLVVVIPFW